MSRHEITDQQWTVIEKLIPRKKSRKGRPQADPRKTLNGIIHVLKTGCAWADMPRKYGSYTTCWRRLKEWQKAGVWERIWQKLLQMLDEKGGLDWSKGFLDGSFVAAKRGGEQIGITKIGKGSKIMTIAEGNGIPIGLYITSANHHEIKLVQPTLESVRVPQRRGRPKSRLKELIADRAYHSQHLRCFLRKRGIKPTIPLKRNSKKRKGRPVAVGDGYRQRWKIERCFAWMDNYRRIVVRYERYIQHYKAFCLIALILFCLNRVISLN